MALVRKVSIPVSDSVSDDKSLRHKASFKGAAEQFLITCINPTKSNFSFVLLCQPAIVLHGTLIVDYFRLSKKNNPWGCILDSAPESMCDKLVV